MVRHRPEHFRPRLDRPFEILFHITSANPISGTFANLADGATVIAGPNTLVADYSGGNGNDLTLTVQ